MKIKILNQKNPHYDADRWMQIRALVKGGKHFHELIRKFLPKNPVEPTPIYFQRCQEAHYHSYMGSIVNLYVSWLFAANFSIKPYKRDTDEPLGESDPFYGQFQENVGAETTLTQFMKDRFREAISVKKAHWLIELPPNDGVKPDNKAEYEKRGLGRATLRAIDREDLLDYECDDKGELEWCIVYSCNTVREKPTDERNTVVEQWRIYDRENVTTFESRYKKGEKPPPTTDLTGSVASHGLRRVPLICLELKEELCIGYQTYDPQLEHFRRSAGLSWLIRRTCYAQPIFKLADGDKPPTMGAGTAIVIGTEDEMSWTSPPTAPFDVLQKNVEAKRDDIYRIVHQMAQAVDNNAETVGRSADSKEIDAAATRVMLNEYGSQVAKAIEETLEVISEARDDTDYEWSVEGFSGYDTATASTLLENIQKSRLLGIPSVSFHKEVCTKAALALLPEVDERVKATIRSEIEAAKFDISSKPLEIAKADLEEAKLDSTAAKAELDRAKAAAEPIKAKAALKTASRPAPKPSGPVGGLGQSSKQ